MPVILNKKTEIVNLRDSNVSFIMLISKQLLMSETNANVRKLLLYLLIKITLPLFLECVFYYENLMVVLQFPRGWHASSNHRVKLQT